MHLKRDCLGTRTVCERVDTNNAPKSLFRFWLLKAHGMGLPSANEIQTLVLKSLQDQNAHSLIEVKESIARRFNVSDSERKKMSSKRARPIFDSKIVQVLSQLRKNGFDR